MNKTIELAQCYTEEEAKLVEKWCGSFIPDNGWNWNICQLKLNKDFWLRYAKEKEFESQLGLKFAKPGEENYTMP